MTGDDHVSRKINIRWPFGVYFYHDVGSYAPYNVELQVVYAAFIALVNVIVNVSPSLISAPIIRVRARTHVHPMRGIFRCNDRDISIYKDDTECYDECDIGAPGARIISDEILRSVFKVNCDFRFRDGSPSSCLRYKFNLTLKYVDNVATVQRSPQTVTDANCQIAKLFAGVTVGLGHPVYKVAASMTRHCASLIVAFATLYRAVNSRTDSLRRKFVSFFFFIRRSYNRVIRSISRYYYYYYYALSLIIRR